MISVSGGITVKAQSTAATIFFGFEYVAGQVMFSAEG
jgi:hypothetical protein